MFFTTADTLNPTRVDRHFEGTGIGAIEDAGGVNDVLGHGPPVYQKVGGRAGFDSRCGGR
jgi:hypothetical protein